MLPAEVPDLEEPAKCTGLLAISISKSEHIYLVWFRPEAVRWVEWAGDPNKPAQPDPSGPQRLHPRHSFATWRESVRGRSVPWDAEEVAAARELRDAILGILLRRAS